MTRFECKCEEPRPFPQAEKAHTCVTCSGEICDWWVPNDKTVDRFFSHLQDGLYPLIPEKDLPEDWLAFRSLCESREKEGRGKFGLRCLARNNPADALEEIADYCLYLLFDVLKARRAREDDELDIALEGVRAAFRAYQCATYLHSAAPRPISEYTPA